MLFASWSPAKRLMSEPLKLQFKPGINRDSTDYGNTGGWYDINLARWVSGTPQAR